MSTHFAVHKALKEWIDEIESTPPYPLQHPSPETFSPTSAVESEPGKHEGAEGKREENTGDLRETRLFTQNGRIHVVGARDQRSRSPLRKSCTMTVFENPWAKRNPLDLRMLKSNDELVRALEDWNMKIQNVSVQSKADLVITFLPCPAIVCESQLHQRIAAMGIDVYPKGACPGHPPFGVQGGQAGQYSVGIVFSKEPMLKITIQMQRAKGNVVAKGKRSMFETSVIMTLLPYLGSPVNVAVGVCSKSRPKQATKENVPLMKASAPSVFDQWKTLAK